MKYWSSPSADTTTQSAFGRWRPNYLFGAQTHRQQVGFAAPLTATKESHEN
jgi:hypothetical protein